MMRGIIAWEQRLKETRGIADVLEEQKAELVRAAALDAGFPG